MAEDGQLFDRNRDDLEFGYRRCNIAAPLILEVEFDLQPDDPARLMKRYKEVYLYKKNSQPMGDKSAGCCFKNPAPPTDGPGKPAGRLIDEAGLKGFSIGGATVSPVHANFITAEPGRASAADILAVMRHVEETVDAVHGVRLEREIVVW
jgi:UDP-N-acetylmuramate dehydrogenase